MAKINLFLIPLLFFEESGCNEMLKSNGHGEHTGRSHGGGPKTWTQEDMELALDALRNHNMSLTKVIFQKKSI